MGKAALTTFNGGAGASGVTIPRQARGYRLRSMIFQTTRGVGATSAKIMLRVTLGGVDIVRVITPQAQLASTTLSWSFFEGALSVQDTSSGALTSTIALPYGGLRIPPSAELTITFGIPDAADTWGSISAMVEFEEEPENDKKR